MSCRSFNSRGPLDLEAMLNDIEDLDYEPDGFDEEQLLQEDDQAEPTEQSFDGNSVASSGGISKSIKSFRSNMNYKAMHIGIPKDSFRNNYVPYLESTGSRHLDSSDEESELQFSDSEPTEGFTSNEGSNLQRLESPIESLYTESYIDQNSCDSFLVSPTSIGGDNTPNYNSKSVFNNVTACSNNLVQEKPRIKASNFTIQVKGNQRFCLDPFKEPKQLSAQNVKTKQMRGRWFPWKIKLHKMRKKFPNVKCLRSTDEVIQYTPKKNTNSSVSIVSSESNFKVPLKRPPTRQKPSSISVSVNANSGVKVVKDVEKVDDDIISIIGSTSMIGLGENVDVDNKLIDQQNAVKMSRVAEWVDQTEELRPIITEQKKIPSVYKGLCYRFFFTNQCTLKACKNLHTITLHKQRLANLNNQELMEACNFAKSEPVLFSKIFHVFADIFASRDNKLALIEIIETILVTLSAESRIEGVNTVLKQLQRCKRLAIFEDVIEYVRAKVDTKKHPMLGKILIEIIISMDNLPTNWPVLRKMCNVGQVIPQRLAGKLLINLMRNPIDRQVCQEVWTHINEHKCLNLQLVPGSVRESFLKICGSNEIKNVQCADELEATVEQQLSRARNNFEQQTAKSLQHTTLLNSIPGFSLASFDFSVPPPTFGKSAMPMRTVNTFVNTTQPSPHAFKCENMPDFASLNQQQSTFADADSNQAYLQPPQLICGPRSRKRSTSSTGSSTGIFSDTDTPNRIQTPQSNTRSASLMYNSQGQQYNPLDDYDYCPTAKRRHVDHTTIYDYNVQAKGSDRAQTTVAQAQEANLDHAVDDWALWTREQNAENVVTSSSELQSRNRKAPDQPIFGRIYFDPNYEFNVSLHNSYLQRIDNVDINEDDVLTLNECVKSGNGVLFLDLLQKYVAPSTIQNFISMTLAHLKGTNQMVARIYKKLLVNIENVNPYYYGDLNVRVVLEVITMNILFEFDRRAMYQDAKDVLMKFPDWDSLITSRLFITDTYTGVSIVGRYLFIARLLVSCQPELTYEILTCPNLHLLEESYKWPYHPATPIPEICEADLNNRNLVLKKFLECGFLLNAVAVVQLYKLVLKQKGEIWRFDVRRFINPMLLYLINHKKILQLKQINAEFSMFVNHLDRNILRSFLVSMIGHLSSEDSFSILEHCISKNIYQPLVCNRILTPVIEIKTDMCNKEIDLIVLYYFHKLVELRSFSPGNQSLTFEIKLPGLQSETYLKLLPHVLHQSRSIVDTNQYIRQVLSEKCGVSAISNVPTVVEVPAETLVNYIQIY